MAKIYSKFLKKIYECGIIIILHICLGQIHLKGGDILSKETILKIKEAEEQAAQIRASAYAQAKARIAETERLGKRLCEQTEASATEENTKKLELIREKAGETVLNARETAEAEAKEGYSSAGLNMREAIRYIIGGITEQCQ